MRCVRCGFDSKYKERADRICPSCKGEFAFEPQFGNPVTDMLFRNAIDAVSGNGKLRWGVEHLYYEICRRKRRKPVPIIFILLLFVGAGVLIGVMGNQNGGTGFLAMLTIVVLIAGIASLITRFRGPYVRYEHSVFRPLWDRWVAIHGKPAGVIERMPQPARPEELEADIGDYSFDRAVICDRARTVDLLVANNFHFENNCAVLSIDGYPKGPFQLIRQMLKRNPQLQVFAIHDCSPAGCRLAQTLVSDPEWFGGTGIGVIDLGLRPRHAGPFRGLLLEAEQRIDPTDGIRPGEEDWLSRYRLELAAIRPEQVLKRLFAGLTAHANDKRKNDESTGDVTYCGSFEAGGAGDGGDGGADAFG